MYVSGYVARQLLRCYKKKSGEVYSQYVYCLSEMAVAEEGNDVLAYTRERIAEVVCSQSMTMHCTYLLK